MTVTTAPSLARTADEVYAVLADLDRPVYVVGVGGGVAVTADERAARAPGVRVLAAAPPTGPDRLGSPAFRRHHGVRWAYMAGAMANGIASERLVVAMARAGLLASYGAASRAPAGCSASARSPSTPPRTAAPPWSSSPTRPCTSARRRPRRATSTSPRSPRRRAVPGRTRSTPATASSPRTRTSPRCARRRASCSSARPPT